MSDVGTGTAVMIASLEHGDRVGNLTRQAFSRYVNAICRGNGSS